MLHRLVTSELHKRMDRQIARQDQSRVEVLVEPSVPWDEDIPLVPPHEHLLLSLFPHHRELSPVGIKIAQPGPYRCFSLCTRFGIIDMWAK